MWHRRLKLQVHAYAATLDTDSVSTDRVHWIFKNKDQGKTAATASLGLVTLWDVEGGLPQIDKFLYSKDNYVVAGGDLDPSICSSISSEMAS